MIPGRNVGRTVVEGRTRNRALGDKNVTATACRCREDRRYIGGEGQYWRFGQTHRHSGLDDGPTSGHCSHLQLIRLKQKHVYY